MAGAGPGEPMPGNHEPLDAGRESGGPTRDGRASGAGAPGGRAPGSDPGTPTADDLRALLVPAGTNAYDRLNPLTKVVTAAAAIAIAFLVGGFSGPILALAALVVPGALFARRLRALLGFAVAVSIPLAVSVVLVSVFTRPGTTPLFSVGPFDATLEGVIFAGQVLLRLLVVALAAGLFVATTPPRALMADLERRGLPARAVFILTATLEAVPALAERAASVSAAQRARGLDTEGNLRRRAAGVLPLIGPVVLSALGDVEVRGLALEARAFGRPGPRHLLWAPPDRGPERAVRWVMGVAMLAVLVARATGLLPALG
jgi:energy-coupling factor transport system permease protein